MNKNKSLNLTKNISFLNLNSNTQKQCDFVLDKAVLKQASEIFAKDLFDYAKTGGDMKSIKLKNVYGNNVLSKQHWTCEIVCDMCLLNSKKENKYENESSNLCKI